MAGETDSDRYPYDVIVHEIGALRKVITGANAIAASARQATAYLSRGDADRSANSTAPATPAMAAPCQRK
jgi:hypothetical protein